MASNQDLGDDPAARAAAGPPAGPAAAGPAAGLGPGDLGPAAVSAAGLAAGDLTVEKGLGLAKDAVAVGETGVSVGFGIAKWATDAGFGIASTCLRAPADLLEAATAGPNPVSLALRTAYGVVDVAHKAATTGQAVAKAITQASLQATKCGLSAAGARDGELLRLAVGDEAAEAVMAVEAMVRRFSHGLKDVPLQNLLSAASAWGALQHAALAERTRGPEFAELAELPEHSERWLRFTAATFGPAWFAGLVEGFSVETRNRARASRDQGSGPGDSALACAGVEGNVEVLAFEERTTEWFAPGYLVAVDYEIGVVVLAIRGTSSFTDGLTDLVCEPLAVQLGGHDGLAHGGMWRAAHRMQGTFATLVEGGLAKLAAAGRPPHVVVCGHSLGAGVASLLAALWRDLGRFPGVDVQCVAFACPQVLDSSLAAAQSNHTASFVLGDDMVPRFSLATSQDLRAALLILEDPRAHGLEPSLQTEAVFAADARGDRGSLASAFASIRSLACTSPGRLFPSGRLIHLVEGSGGTGLRAMAVGHEVVDQLFISSDMASAHMPRRYLLALREAEEAAAAAPIPPAALLGAA